MVHRLVTGPRIVTVLIVVVLVGAFWFMLRKPALGVETAQVVRAPLVVTVDDLAESRVKDLYTVSAPVTGELLRVPLKSGAEVVQGRTLLADLQPVQPNPVDSRSYAQTVATIASLQAQLAAAQARVQEARAAEVLARNDFARVDQLIAKGFVSRARHDEARAALDQARAARTAAASGEAAALHSLQAEQAVLTRGTHAAPGQAISVTSPVSGRVLRVLQESRRPVVAGTPLIEIGDPGRLEVVADLLSTDAVKVKPGARVLIDAWGGDRPLEGRVRLIEPYGFTKISALGVEEQRVNVIIDLAEPRVAWERLGHGYRVTARIELWSGSEVTRVPVDALFREGNGWAAFVVDKGKKARRVAVKVGHMSDEAAEVLEGLRPGDRVILHPSEKVVPGLRVAPE